MARNLPPHLASQLVVPDSITVADPTIAPTTTSTATAAATTAGNSNGAVPGAVDILAVASAAYRRRVMLRHTAEGWIDLTTSLHFRAVRNSATDHPAARVQLAAEAVGAAKEAIRLAPSSHVCWTTLGVAAAGAKNPALSQHVRYPGWNRMLCSWMPLAQDPIGCLLRIPSAINCLPAMNTFFASNRT